MVSLTAVVILRGCCTKSRMKHFFGVAIPDRGRWVSGVSKMLTHLLQNVTNITQNPEDGSLRAFWTERMPELILAAGFPRVKTDGIRLDLIDRQKDFEPESRVRFPRKRYAIVVGAPGGVCSSTQ